MMNVVRYRHTFPHRGPLYPPRSDVPHLPVKKPIPTCGDTSVKQLIFRPIPPNDRTTKDWTAIAWPTNIQSRTPDGKFGPAKQMENWSDCWFLASLAAVANDPDGQKLLAESIKKVTVEGISGYDVTFKGSQNNKVFISDAELQEFLEPEGGDADTRLIELAADKFFKKIGNFKSLFLDSLIGRGWNQEVAERCLQELYGNKDLMTYNPMRDGAAPILAFFMLTNMAVDVVNAARGTTMQRDDVMSFLNQYITNDRDGGPVVIDSIVNPLGDGLDAVRLVIRWDAIRTEITSNGTVDKQEQAFLNALERWLATRRLGNIKDLRSAADDLKLEHVNPVDFVDLLARNRFHIDRDHFNVLRSAVREVLGGGPGYIGFPGVHDGTIEGINAARNTFAYSEPNYPALVHTGELSRLIEAIQSGNVNLFALKPTAGQDEAESSHAGEQRGRHLRQIHHQVVRDGKIDPAESGPLANLMEMNDGAFWQVYDSDKNGVIEGGELKAVQLRVGRWADHLKLTPIW